MGLVVAGCRRPQIASCGVSSAASWSTEVISRFLGTRRRHRRLAVSWRVAGWAVGWSWVRVDDESKRRCQGLVVCRATLPFVGFCDARPGVTLAPTFAAAGLAACQSRTVRV